MSSVPVSLGSLENLDQLVAPGADQSFRLTISESYSGVMIQIPIFVRRGASPGPSAFITAALHGNEINGTGAITHVIRDPPFRLLRGRLVMVPVVNVHGFETYSRYLPDRRDLNRSFPGSAQGSLAARMAHRVFQEIVKRCDFGIDLHTAAVRRTNFPNVRGDFNIPEIKKLGVAFGCQWMINSHGPLGSLRREATRQGVPTIILEAGEVWKVEPRVVAVAMRGIRNVLASQNMTDEAPEPTPMQQVIEKTRWVRAERGGFLEFHVAPGEVVRCDQPLATNNSLFGAERNVLYAPCDAVVIGMTTLPAASPGEPVIHLGEIPRSLVDLILSPELQHRPDPLHDQVKEDLATNIVVTPKDASSDAASPND